MNDENNYDDFQNPDSDYMESKTPASPYKNKGSAKKPPRKKRKFKKPKDGEVTILSTFVWDPEIDGKTEIEYLLTGKWSPSIYDFMEIAGPTKISPGNFCALLGMIEEFEPKSIERLNFFTHADSDTIGITGTIDEHGVNFKNSVHENDLLDNIANNYTYTYNKKSFVLNDIRERFKDDAIFVLYGCKAGFYRTTLITALKDLLNVIVIGFKEKIVFCPPKQKKDSNVFKRKGEKIGINKNNFSCDSDSINDWRLLINDPNAVKVPK